MTKKIYIVALTTLLLWPGFAKADITVAMIAPLTGKYAVMGEQIQRGARQAVAALNAAGGIHGQKLVLREFDDACDPKQAVAAANDIASAGIKFVIGHYCSGSAIPASKVYMDENILLISPAATNPQLTDEGKDVIFRICGRDDTQGAIVGQYIVSHMKGKKIAIAEDQSAYGRGLADEVQKTLHKAGLHETLYEVYTPSERDYSPLVTKLKQAGIDVLFIGGYHTETGLIARQLKEQGAKIQIMGGDSLVTEELWSIAGPAAEGILMTFGPDLRNRPEAKDIVATMRKSGFEPEGYTLNSFAAVQALASALQTAGKPEPSAVAAALRANKVSTLLGPVQFDAKGDVVGPTYVLYRWHDGHYIEAGE